MSPLTAPTPLFPSRSPRADGKPSLFKNRTRRFGSDQLLFAVCFGSCLIVVGMLLALVIVLVIGAMPSIPAIRIAFPDAIRMAFRRDRTAHARWQDRLRRRRRNGHESADVRCRGCDLRHVRDLGHGAAPRRPTELGGSVVSDSNRSALAVGTDVISHRVSRGDSVACVRVVGHVRAGALPSRSSRAADPVAVSATGRSCDLIFHDKSGRLIAATGSDLFAGGIILAVMILPIITAISRDVLRAVPRAQIEGSIALGATWWQSAKEMLKFSRQRTVRRDHARPGASRGRDHRCRHGDRHQHADSIFALRPPLRRCRACWRSLSAKRATTTEKASLIQVALVLLIMSLIFNIISRYLFVGKASRPAASA